MKLPPLKCYGFFTRTYSWSLTVGALIIVISCVHGENMETQDEQMAYLKKYAYLDSEMSNKLASYTNEEDRLKLAVTSFQRMAGLNVTGAFDNATVEMMKMSRCGVKDQMTMGNIARRRKRYAAEGSVWPKSTITYEYSGPLTRDMPEDTVKREIKRAFELWSGAVPGLKIVEGSPGDIIVKFAATNHGDGNPFDGRGKVLAHAFFPKYGGDIHFDDDETWTAHLNSGTNLLQVAVHELGHSLGLGHSSVKEAIMAPFYRGYIPNVKLHADDITGMQYLYRAKVRPNEEDWCKNSQFDAIVEVASELMVFKGKKYARIDVDGIIPGYPKDISGDWPGLPDGVDAALHWTENITDDRAAFPPTHVYFFKDENCYLFEPDGNKRFKMKSDFPKLISQIFPGLPSNIDAAFVWSGNGRPYFVKGNKYYRYTRGTKLDDGYPRSLSIWKGLPAKIDAAFNWQRVGRTYFFSGNQFYRFNDMDFKTDSGYPKSTGPYWLGCPRDDMAATLGEKKAGSLMMMEMNEGPRQFVEASSGSLLPSRILTSLAIIMSFIILSIKYFHKL